MPLLHHIGWLYRVVDAQTQSVVQGEPGVEPAVHQCLDLMLQFLYVLPSG